MLENEPDMEWLIQYTPPIPREHLDPLQDILRTRDPFVSAIWFDDPYEVASYLPRQMLGREEFCLLADRNVVTRWVGMVRGHRVTPAHRAAAAVMAFAQCTDFLIEPTLAFYEIQSIASPEEINAEISDFYTAEEADPQAWADIALGRSNRLSLPPLEARRPRKSFDLTLPLYRWRRCYVLALKVAEMHLRGGTPERLMTSLIDWMYREFLIGAPALQLASYYFAPGAPRKKLLKSIESPNRAKALHGIRNAAWDLTLISEWLYRVRKSIDDPDEKRMWVMCTFDEAVTRMAAQTLSYDETDDEASLIRRSFAKVWAPDVAARLARRLHDYQLDRSNPARYLNRDPKAEAIDGLIAAGEEVIQTWRPRRGSA